MLGGICRLGALSCARRGPHGHEQRYEPISGKYPSGIKEREAESGFYSVVNFNTLVYMRGGSTRGPRSLMARLTSARTGEWPPAVTGADPDRRV